MNQSTPYPFDAETWGQLPAFFDNLPEPVHIHMWGDTALSRDERETAVLCQTLADHFPTLHFRQFPRRINYPYYPVIGLLGEKEGDPHDYGVRIIGWPHGMQLTSLITAIQVVAFQGQTLEPKTRIQLRPLPREVKIEVLTAADNEAGALVAKIAFGLAVASDKVKTYLIMADRFQEALTRYSVNELPHTVINGRVHIGGVVDEDVIMQHLAKAVKNG